uniref:Mads box protein n=1 Tax=Solanum tuberosum TaxID=4113 RepID=M1DT80_SOLTU
MKNSRNKQVTFSKRHIGLFRKASELCTLCGAYVVVVIFSSSNKVYSCGHPSVELIVDKFLRENPQPDSDSPNPTIVAHQNLNVDEINNELNKLENSLERQKKHGEALKSLRNELAYEQLNFFNLKMSSKILVATDEEVERVAGQLMECNIEFPYQTIRSALDPLRVEENCLSDFDEGPSRSHE